MWHSAAFNHYNELTLIKKLQGLASLRLKSVHSSLTSNQLFFFNQKSATPHNYLTRLSPIVIKHSQYVTWYLNCGHYSPQRVVYVTDCKILCRKTQIVWGFLTMIWWIHLILSNKYLNQTPTSLPYSIYYIANIVS